MGAYRGHAPNFLGVIRHLFRGTHSSAKGYWGGAFVMREREVVGKEVASREWFPF
jgi:hypothetical protein